jgi:hypothetical protein
VKSAAGFIKAIKLGADYTDRTKASARSKPSCRAPTVPDGLTMPPDQVHLSAPPSTSRIGPMHRTYDPRDCSVRKFVSYLWRQPGGYNVR